MIQIGTLRVSFEQREIRRDGIVMRIGARAFDVLEVLYRANNTMLSKDAIMDAVWPGAIVEENRLQVHVAALRKLLGAERDLIKTVAGRGYVLVVPNQSTASNMPNASSTAGADAGGAVREAAPLPSLASLRVVPLIGRETEIARIVEQFEHVPVTTIVGAGGIGKTCLARHAAREMQRRQGRAVCFVELNKASSRETVFAALAEALDLQGEPGVSCEDAICEAVAASNCLLVLDNAEHVIDVVAGFVDTLVARHHGARLLVTSREPLHIWAESVLRLEPLAVPANGASTEAILAHSAVALFLCRARALAPDCARDEASIALVAEICRRLEGLPLAIELAAARVATLGVEGVASRLDDRLNLLTGGLRSTLPRHQTLRATFEWSYMLLDAASRILFRRSGCFAGAFTFEAVCAVTAEPGMSIAVIVSSLSELATKSLLNVEFRGAIAVYRLTESTRAYALEKLRDEGESQIIATRHVRYMRKRIEESGPFVAQTEHEGADVSTRLSLDDARSAYDWAFSDDGDKVLGVALAGALVGTLLSASRVQECCQRAQRALAVLDTLPAGSVDVVCEMKLCAAYATSLLHVGDDMGRAVALWERVLRLARAADDAEFAADALWGLWNTMQSSGDIHTSLRYATRFQHASAACDSPWRRWLAEQTLAISLHCCGEHDQARERLERTVEAFTTLGATAPSRGWLTVYPLIYARGTLARIALLQCQPAKAMQLVESTLDLIHGDALEPSLSHVLACVAVPIALDCGERQLAANYLALLRSQSASHRLEIWLDYTECLAAKRDMLAGHADVALERLENALPRLASRGFRRVVTPFVVLHAQTLAHAGRFEEARTRLDEALASARANGERYFAPELQRARGWLELRRAAQRGTPPDDVARREEAGRRLLDEAISMARADGAPLWALRATLDLATYEFDKGETARATALIDGLEDSAWDRTSNAPDFQRLAALRQTLQSARTQRTERLAPQ
ncbi:MULTISPECIES: winged helix-turn-helix domain-containing protein [Paraburkholderia]|uniref:ATPase n=1 Tax=Paraburkholderia tropica TaxID=92647 RepID=A0ABX5MNN8_9BURK|nr:winged helix-turn-helix domain-containing protein [Paraburkholderia tropica]MDE1144871.1 winged helix-turn-helix domain-containing protein [Paraburkholderia tropica]PXX15737.1 putative ATPase [Paraburkholderia tropica]PZW81996.1 putative ATPase [Paraburkholderia tropica]